MPVRSARRLISRPGGLGAPQTSSVLPVPMYTQQQSMWCWAACIEMVVTYYNTAAVQQCQIVNSVVGRNDCCSRPTSGWCNTSVPTATYCPAYASFGVNQCAPMGSAVPFATIQSATQGNWVLEVVLAWRSGGSHVALACGWSDTPQATVFVNDPHYGAFWTTYAALLQAYGLGQWIDTWALRA